MISIVGNLGDNMLGVCNDINALYPARGGGSVVQVQPLDARICFLDNSWGAQPSNIDVLQFAWMRMGCRGHPTIGMRQARGGDSLLHLKDRIAPAVAVKAGVYYLMNIENSLGDYGPDSAGAGAGMLTDLQDIINDLQDAQGDEGYIVVPTQPNSVTALANPLAVDLYNTNIPASDRIIVFDEAAVVDLQDVAESSDAKHPTTRLSAKAVGDAIGDALAALYVSEGIFDANLGVHPLRIGTFNSATAWIVANPGSTGLTTVSQTQSTLVSNGRGSRKFVFSGTALVAETDSGSTGDVRLRYAYPITVGSDPYGWVIALLSTLEITNAAQNGPPANLATITVSSGVSSAFSKQYLASHAGYWTEQFMGPFGVYPGVLGGYATSQNVDITFRGVQGSALDLCINIGDLNLIRCDAAAYGAPAPLSGFFTNDATNRPILAAAPGTNPSNPPTASIIAGATLAVLAAPRIAGGGLTYTFDVMRNTINNTRTTGNLDGTWTPSANGGDYVATIRPQDHLSVAVVYMSTVADSGHNLAVRTNVTQAGTALTTTVLSDKIGVT